MELFLNILWVLIALASLGIWRGVWKDEKRQTEHGPIEEWTAFAVVLVFLFFAVSLSDDLHAAAILSDDCGGRRSSLVVDCTNHAHRHCVKVHFSSAALPDAIPVPPAFRVVARIIPAIDSSGIDTEVDSAGSRAPPFRSF
jgi:hypothetical protein